MEVRLCGNKQEWDAWFFDQGMFEFLQSWDWGEFQKSTEKEILRLQCMEEGKVKAQVQGFFHPLLGSLRYFYAPRAQVLKKTLDSLIHYLKNKSIVFVRLEPLVGISSLRRIYSVPCRQPQQTLILDITKTSRELLEQMHPKTRYNIRLAQKKGVELEEAKNIDVFWRLNEETTKRDDFKSHHKNYYQQMLRFDFVHQLNAWYEGQPIASVLFIIFGQRCTYAHGASASEQRSVMAPYFLQWSAIQFAQALHCTEYDFGGIAPMAQSDFDANPLSSHGFQWQGNHRFTGITRFKVGFGGERRDYPEAVEIPLQKWKYKVYKLIKKIR